MSGNNTLSGRVSRRKFLKNAAGGALVSSVKPGLFFNQGSRSDSRTAVFHVANIPDNPFYRKSFPNLHAGLDCLLNTMGKQGLKFYRSERTTALGGPEGLIKRDDVVLIKVNAQWKYRGCTNSDVIRGLIERILDHPDTFTGEVVILENGQGRGSLNCDTTGRYYPDADMHANANDTRHSFLFLVNSVFNDPLVSAYLLDPVRGIFIDVDDHFSDGYRKRGKISYPCFTTVNGTRIELREGIWDGSKHRKRLKLINVPVLKHHDVGFSEITGALKHFYGLVSMDDGFRSYRHTEGLGKTAGQMIASVRAPVLNVIDAIWVSHGSLNGYPEGTTFRTNQLAASQDPVALDYWAAKNILYPVDSNLRHHPDFSGIKHWLCSAEEEINRLGGIGSRRDGIRVNRVTLREDRMSIHSEDTAEFLKKRIFFDEPPHVPLKRETAP